MKKFLLSIIGLAMTASVQAGTIQNGLTIFSYSTVCDGSPHTLKWTTPTAINLAEIQIWNGIDKGTTSDIPEIVIRNSDGNVVIAGGHDDYTNGGSVRIQKESWGGNKFPLAAGDGLTFSFLCTEQGIPHNGGWVVTIWTVN